jgi:2-dehydro-3-deoxyphosphogluconate aldolase/(4S)-4-hydroxy-2-oxoglutarate aldolase
MNVKILNVIEQSGLISIIRGVRKEHIIPVISALYDAGIVAVEITLDTPDALDMIDAAKHDFGNTMVIGAGTVLDAVTARTAILAGADFILSPILDIEMIRLCNTYAKIAVPGVFSPTEALSAWRAGAPLVKIFPANVLGPMYIKGVVGPLSQLHFLPVGGITLENARKFMEAGAYALGVGSEIVNKKRTDAGNVSEIRSTAEQFLSIIKEFKKEN